MQNQEKHGKLVIDQKGAIQCPNCRKNIKKIRLRPGAQMREVNVRCSECRYEFTVNIDLACAVYSSSLRR